MRLSVVLIILYTSLNVHADILHLRDGSRHHGTLLKQTGSVVVFRIALSDGASAVRTFPASRVIRVERTALQPHARDQHDLDPEAPSEDFGQMVREACELVDDGDLAAAVRALQRVVRGAQPDVLEQLDPLVKAARGCPLDEFLAMTRIRAALEAGRGRRFVLEAPTRFETDALGVQLVRLHDRLLATSYHGRTIESWAENRDEYTELQPDARRMVADARLAAAVIGARLRHDPQSRSDRAERGRLARLRDELARFAARVSALPGYTAMDAGEPDENDPTLREARRLADEQTTTTRPAAETPESEAAP